MSKSLRSRRKGALVVLAALILVVVVMVLAFAIDLGFLCAVRTDLQGAADAGALAGAAELADSAAQADLAAREFVHRNAEVADEDIEIQYGRWDRTGRSFVPNSTPRDALEVIIRQPQAPLFFGRIAGRNSQPVAARATAAYQPRDMVLVLDFSGSMNNQRRIEKLKDAVDLFVSVLTDTGAPDRVGFARYSTTGELVAPLTDNLANVSSEVRRRNADGWTNIGEGMERGRLELLANARAIAGKMMVLMTDGLVNRPTTRDCRAYVLDEAYFAADEKIAMVTISFGDEADRGLMEQVADIAGGVHFHVPDTVTSEEEDLREVFRKIALSRTPMLVD